MPALNINGKTVNADVPEDTPLLWTLRDVLGMTGTKFGCGMALCGACTVHVDGAPTRACVTPVSAVAGKKITTIEAIGADPVGNAVQTAWLEVGLPRLRSAGKEAKKYGADSMPNGWVDSPLAFVAIAEDGTVTITCHRQEMGQGVRTSLPMVVADELEADWARVRVQQAGGDQERFGNQDTDGSRSMRHFFEPMRRCGASARTMLRQAGAARWGVPIDEVRALNHEVVHAPSQRKLGYGELAVAASRLPVPARDTLRLKKPAEFRYIGKGKVKLVDGPDMVAGRGKYGIDTVLDGMLFAVVAPYLP